MYHIQVFYCLLEFAGDEMFTDSYTMKVTDDGIFYEVEGNVSKIERTTNQTLQVYINHY